MKIRIYQINMDRDKKRVAFRALENLQNSQIDSSIYDCVFSGYVDCEGLEDVFQMFNADPPEGYKGRSLSVSDVVEIIESDSLLHGFYFCDSIGFKKIDFDADKTKPLKDDYYSPITPLLLKMKEEFQEYENGLLKKTAEEILSSAFEYATKQDIVFFLEENEIPDEYAEALLESDTPLDDIFQQYQKDLSRYNERIDAIIGNRARTILGK